MDPRTPGWEAALVTHRSLWLSVFNPQLSDIKHTHTHTHTHTHRAETTLIIETQPMLCKHSCPPHTAGNTHTSHVCACVCYCMLLLWRASIQLRTSWWFIIKQTQNHQSETGKYQDQTDYYRSVTSSVAYLTKSNNRAFHTLLNPRVICYSKFGKAVFSLEILELGYQMKQLKTPRPQLLN